MCFLCPVRTKYWFIVGLCLLLFTASGCGEVETTGTVSGTVSLDGSPLAVAADVVFQEAVTGHGASATIKEGAFQFEKPVITGDYKVYVQATPPVPNPMAATSETLPPAVEIPARYRLASGKSPLKATVVEGENKFDFELEK